MRNLKGLMVSLIATGLGAGFSPKAPGTAGTVVGLLLAFGIREWSAIAQVLVFTALFFAGWWATLEWSRNTRQPDSQRIVIDEILGYGVAICLLPKVPLVLWVQFGLFRLFDAAKPPPIRQVDRFGKRFEIGPLQSLFVILDDLVAGVFALGFGWALLRMFGADFGVDIPRP